MVWLTGDDEVMDDRGFVDWISAELAALPGVVAVALGGSRARGGHVANSDWDLAVYYRQRFEPDALRAKRWPGEVSDLDIGVPCVRHRPRGVGGVLARSTDLDAGDGVPELLDMQTLPAPELQLAGSP